jgi:hypothetical protein
MHIIIGLRLLDTIFLIPEITITGTEFPEKGSSIFLLCNAKGKKYPPDAIEWYKNGERITSFDKIYIKDHVAQNAGVLTSSLEIKNAKPEDNGTYICRATSHNDEPKTTRMIVSVLSGMYNFSNCWIFEIFVLVNKWNNSQYYIFLHR